MRLLEYVFLLSISDIHSARRLLSCCLRERVGTTLPVIIKMPPSPKKQKVAASGGFFSEIPAIKYEGPDSTNPLAFKYYDPEEVIMGKKMKDWCRFAVCFWHTWRGMGADIFGLGGTMERPWDQGHATELDAAMNRVDVHFEFCKRLGIEYYCFHE